ncbi:uncharacterized protein LOC122067493 [Macadamia integrifolia]|uniref:uncharacterized protein LOC122067493 n=1 Tax=Macadamia integrifolia TaxID=60698 RepID=UPI001C501780|nr:uncharacterized protein LOC122067493 [Macadamia integrifolia]
MVSGERNSTVEEIGFLAGGRPPDRAKQRLITDFLQPRLSFGTGCTPAPAVPIVDVCNTGLSSLPKKSFSKAVGGVLPDVADLPDPIHAGNLTKIVIPQDAYEERLLRYRFALVARINFRFISLDEVRKEAVNSWKLKEKVFIKPMGLGYTLFQFEAEKDMTNIWKQSPIKIGRQFIRFQRWKPDFNIHDNSPISKLVWIRFPGLPFEYWHERILLSMAKAVGRPLDIDKRTRNASIGNFARVLVEMDSSVQRLEEIQVERRQPGTGDLFWFKQKIIYEDALGKCGFCKKLGHTIQNCKEKRITDAARKDKDDACGVVGAVWVEKSSLGAAGLEISGRNGGEPSIGKNSNSKLPTISHNCDPALYGNLDTQEGILAIELPFLEGSSSANLRNNPIADRLDDPCNRDGSVPLHGSNKPNMVNQTTETNSIPEHGILVSPGCAANPVLITGSCQLSVHSDHVINSITSSAMDNGHLTLHYPEVGAIDAAALQKEQCHGMETVSRKKEG